MPIAERQILAQREESHSSSLETTSSVERTSAYPKSVVVSETTVSFTAITLP